MNASGSSENTSTRTVVAPSVAGLSNPGPVGSCRKNDAPSISRPTTPPRFHNSVAPSARSYQPAAAAADGTASIREIRVLPATPQPPFSQRAPCPPDASLSPGSDAAQRQAAAHQPGR